MSDETTASNPRPPKGRSPAFPGVPLEMALVRAGQLYEKANRHLLPFADAMRLWGFESTKSGNAAVAYSAMKKYGLVEDEGKSDSRMVRLTDLAVEAIHQNPRQSEAIQTAAMRPPVMREWLARYANTGLPPAQTLDWEYVVNGPWTAAGLKEWLRIYNANLQFAGVQLSDTVADSERDDADEEHTAEDDDAGGDEDRSVGSTTRSTRRPSMTYQIPVAKGENVTIQGTFPLTEQKWSLLQTVLQAMKPALVSDELEDPEDD